MFGGGGPPKPFGFGTATSGAGQTGRLKLLSVFLQYLCSVVHCHDEIFVLNWSLMYGYIVH